MKTQTSIVLLIAALAWVLLLTSCDGDNLIPGNETGVWVNPSVTLSGFIEGGNQEITRSGSARREPVSTSIPIGDGMLLEMSLEPDSRASLRAAVGLPIGTKFQVIAVEAGTNTYVSHGNFTLAGGLNTNNDFWIQGGVPYDFICISYNSTTEAPPDPTYHPATKALSPLSVPHAANNRSLLYGKITRTITTSTSVLDFYPLEQKLAKVKLQIDGSYNGWQIQAVGSSSGIYLTPSYSAIMAYNTGDLTATGGASNMYPSWPTSPASAQIHTSDECTLFTSGSTALQVHFPKESLTITSMGNLKVPTYSASTTTFPSLVSLTPGNTYTLKIKLKTPIFAKSNIYWNGSRLTFDETSISNNERFQGVSFLWGSLVGVSPTGIGNTTAYYFIPPAGTAGTWTKIIMANVANHPNWNNGYPYLPHCTDVYLNPYNSMVNYLYDTYPSSHYSDHGYRGDICNYLNSDWRMPNIAEFGIAMANWNTSFSPSAITPTNADGKHLIDQGISLKANGAFFPASGQPLCADPNNIYSGIQGFYWSGIPFTSPTPQSPGDKAYTLSFKDNSLYIEDPSYLIQNRSNLKSVRCVKR
ncbi:MAG: hypothetical protein LBS52_00640 [Dysgonamonadaceae bacterium]|jgi:hypothetical protein|nr:hypothetical protein [Dysgonamonadaceae bacterium]